MTPQTPLLPHSLSSFRTSTSTSIQMTTIETQTEESSFNESLNGTGSVFSSRQLHLNIPTSPSSNYHHQGDDKVTDMSLGSEASSSKTPGGYDAYHKQKAFTGGIEEEEGHASEDAHNEAPNQRKSSIRSTLMKRSVSSTLDEEEEDDDLLDDEDPRHRNSSNNNNEYHNGESSDDMLDTLEGAVGKLEWKVKNANGRRSTSSCRCKCHMHSCHAAPKLAVAVNNIGGTVAQGSRPGSQLTEEDEEEDDAYLDEENHTAIPAHDYGRSVSNETLDSKDTNSSSREDVFAEDGFETFSDEENLPRHDINDFVLKRRS